MMTVPSSLPALYPQVTCISSVVSCDLSTLCFTITKILRFICNVWNISFNIFLWKDYVTHHFFILCVTCPAILIILTISVIVNDYVRIHKMHFIIDSVLFLWGVVSLCQFCVSTNHAAYLALEASAGFLSIHSQRGMASWRGFQFGIPLDIARVIQWRIVVIPAHRNIA